MSLLFYFFSSLRRGDQSTVFCIVSLNRKNVLRWRFSMCTLYLWNEVGVMGSWCSPIFLAFLKQVTLYLKAVKFFKKTCRLKIKIFARTTTHPNTPPTVPPTHLHAPVTNFGCQRSFWGLYVMCVHTNCTKMALSSMLLFGKD